MIEKVRQKDRKLLKMFVKGNEARTQRFVFLVNPAKRGAPF